MENWRGLMTILISSYVGCDYCSVYKLCYYVNTRHTFLYLISGELNPAQFMVTLIEFKECDFIDN